MKGLHTIFSEIIEDFRETKAITLVAASGTNYVYTAINTLSALDYVTLYSGSTVLAENQQVISATSNTFTLSTEYAANSFVANEPYFMHEKWKKAASILTEKTKQDTYKYQKYPLILLERPFTKGNSNYDYSADFRIAIINHTDKNYYSDDRYDNNFDTILTPIKESIIEGMLKHKNLLVANRRKLDFDDTDQLYIDDNPLPDELDAIVLDFKGVTVANTLYCPDDEVEVSDRYDVTTSIVGNGSINSNPETLTNILKNDLVSLNATADSGNRFVSWLVDGVTTTNRIVSWIISKSVTAVATFIERWVLTMSAATNGTISPVAGTYTYDNNETQEIEATPDDGYEFTKWTINGADETQNPYTVVMDAAKTVVAFFASLFGYQEVFKGTSGEIVEADDGTYEWENQGDGNTVNDNILIVVYGNSIVEQDLDVYIKSALEDDDINSAYTYEVVNMGTAGRTGSQMVIDYDSQIAPLYNSAKDCYLLTFEFINDVNHGATAQAAYDNMVSVYNKGTATGFKVIAPTATGAATALDPLNANIQAANDLLRANHSMVHYYFDVWDRFELTLVNGGVYFVDGIHFTTKGKTIWGWNFSYLFYGNALTYSTTNVKIGNTQVGNFQNTAYIETSKYLIGGDAVNLKTAFKVSEINKNQGIFGAGGSGSSALGLSLILQSDNKLYIKSTTAGNVHSAVEIASNIQVGDEFVFQLIWGGGINEDAIYKLNKETFYLTDIWGWTGNSNNTITVGTYANHTALTFHGLIYYCILDNYFKYYIQRGQGSTVKDYSGNGNDGTITGATLSTFWGTKSDYASPERYLRGFNKTLVNEVAGVTAHLASPDGSNLGSEKVVNGDFSDGDANWIQGTWVVIDGVNTNNGSNGPLYQSGIFESGKYYVVDFDIHINSGSVTIREGSNGNGYTISSASDTKRIIIGGTASSYVGYLQIYSSAFDGYIDNVSVKEVTSIPIEGTYEFEITHRGGSNNTVVYFVNDKNNITTTNSYLFNIDSTNAIKFHKFINGSITTLFATNTSYVLVNTKYTIKVVVASNGDFTFYIKGGAFGSEYVLITVNSGSNPINDTSHNTTKFLVVDNDALDEVGKVYKDNVAYDVSKFITQTGTYGVRYDLGVDGSVDVNGETLQYPPLKVTPSENTLQSPDDTALNALYDNYATLGVLRYPALYDYADLRDIDLTGIPEDDFIITKSDDNTNVSDMISNEL
jgi:hypothetical protein